MRESITFLYSSLFDKHFIWYELIRVILNLSIELLNRTFFQVICFLYLTNFSFNQQILSLKFNDDLHDLAFLFLNRLSLALSHFQLHQNILISLPKNTFFWIEVLRVCEQLFVFEEKLFFLFHFHLDEFAQIVYFLFYEFSLLFHILFLEFCLAKVVFLYCHLWFEFLKILRLCLWIFVTPFELILNLHLSNSTYF